jgi:hypothetical protein
MSECSRVHFNMNLGRSMHVQRLFADGRSFLRWSKNSYSKDFGLHERGCRPLTVVAHLPSSSKYSQKQLDDLVSDINTVSYHSARRPVSYRGLRQVPGAATGVPYNTTL